MHLSIGVTIFLNLPTQLLRQFIANKFITSFQTANINWCAKDKRRCWSGTYSCFHLQTGNTLQNSTMIILEKILLHIFAHKNPFWIPVSVHGTGGKKGVHVCTPTPY